MTQGNQTGGARHRVWVPQPERRIHRQARASLGAPPQAGQVRLHRGFINENDAIRQGGNGRQPVPDPVRTLLLYLGATTFGGNQRLFLYVKPSRDRRLAMEE